MYLKIHPVSRTNTQDDVIIDFVVYRIDVSNELNKNHSVISLELIEILTFLHCVSLDMETNPFIIWLKMHTPTSNLKLK